jgi:hypothetical protein
MTKKKRAAAPRASRPAPAEPLEESARGVPDEVQDGADFAVEYRGGAKQHSPGGWLRQNWAWLTGVALRVTSLATRKRVFGDVADALDR